jgi:hypothetical protein
MYLLFKLIELDLYLYTKNKLLNYYRLALVLS